MHSTNNSQHPRNAQRIMIFWNFNVGNIPMYQLPWAWLSSPLYSHLLPFSLWSQKVIFLSPPSTSSPLDSSHFSSSIFTHLLLEYLAALPQIYSLMLLHGNSVSRMHSCIYFFVIAAVCCSSTVSFIFLLINRIYFFSLSFCHWSALLKKNTHRCQKSSDSFILVMQN